MVITIGGASRSGKTRLSVELQKLIDQSVVINQDDYVRPERDIPKINGYTDWESPKSIDWRRFMNEINLSISSHQHVIIEGFLIYQDEKISALADCCLFIELSKENFGKRRTMDNRWSNEPEWYHDHVWESYLKYGLPPESLNIVKIDGNGAKPQASEILKWLTST